MNPVKSQIKISVLNSVGHDIEKLVTIQRAKGSEAEGASQALKIVLEKLPQITKIIQDDIDNASIADVVIEGPLAVGAYCIKQVSRCMNIVENLLMNAERSKIQNEGRVAQTQLILERIAKSCDEESDKLENFLADQLANNNKSDTKSSEDASQLDIPDGRPKMSAADDIAQRKAEAKADKIKNAVALGKEIQAQLDKVK